MIYRISETDINETENKSNEELIQEVATLTEKVKVLDGALQDMVMMKVMEGGEM